MGADKILEKIKQDAIQEAALIVAQGQMKANDVREAILGKAKEKAEAIADHAKKEAEELARRNILMAELESRKNTLISKHVVLDKVFDKALEALGNLDGDRFERLITRIVLDSVSTGEETLRVPAKNMDQYTKGNLLQKLNAALVKEGRTGALKLDGTPAGFEGGVLVVGDDSDVNGSFEALLRTIREQYESEVAALLFRAEVQ